VRLSTEGMTSWTIKLRRSTDDQEELFAELPSEEARGKLPVFLSAAQHALLNPSKNCTDVAEDAFKEAAGSWTATQSEAEPDECSFTEDVVVLEVAGAPVNLTVIDLPGLIQADVKAPQGGPSTAGRSHNEK